MKGLYVVDSCITFCFIWRYNTIKSLFNSFITTALRVLFFTQFMCDYLKY